MSTAAKKVLIIGLIISSFYATAQHTYNHGLFWGRLVLADKITDKLNWELYLQKRTQNIPGQKSIFGSAHYYSTLLWLNYSINKNLKLSVSPLGYYYSYQFLTTPEDADKPGVKEFRWAVKLEQENIYKWLNFSNRYGIEYRRRDIKHNDVYIPNWRLRYMAKLEKPISHIFKNERPVFIFLGDEITIQFGKAVRNNSSVFDQNRISAGFSYEVIRNITTSLSYLDIIQERGSGKDFDNANAILVTMTFENLFSQFKKGRNIK